MCSGIEAATVAWHALGWTPLWFSEIEPFPAAVLKHHYPGVPNLGDMTKFKEWPDAKPDVLVGGTPCQSFSVAGLRRGLEDPRGSLMLTFLAIANRYKPRWIVWENVPGVLSSNRGRDFGTFLGALGGLGYGAAYRVLDAQYFGVPQRRRRVFVGGHLGDWRPAAAVLFERESLRGDPPPRREAREGSAAGAVAGTLDSRHAGGFQSAQSAQSAANGHLIADGVPEVVGALTDGAHNGGGLTDRTPTAGGSSLLPEVARCLHTNEGTNLDWETSTIFPAQARTGGGFDVAHSLRADGFDASEDGTGRGTPLVPVAFDLRNVTSTTNRSNPQPGDPCHTLHKPVDSIVAFSSKDHGADAGEIAPTLRSMGHDGSHANGGGQVAIAIQGAATHENPASGPDGVGVRTDNCAYTLEARQEVQATMTPATQVRRLTPRECERLQGFPDGYTQVPYRGKPAADGPRYKALGNSMAVPVMKWIGERIAFVDKLL